MTDPKALTRAAIILTVIATGLGRLLLGDAYRSYVRPSMFVPLLLSALAIAGLALWTAFGFDDGDDAAAGEHGHEDHGHAHGGLPRIAWWLIVPFACVAIVPLRPLGSSSVRSSGANQAVTQRAERPVEDPPAADGTMSLLDFVSQVVNDPAHPVDGEVRLTGFVQAQQDGGFVLARFVMTCCAADAQPLLVTVLWDDEPPPKDAWATVTGTHLPAAADTAPEERIEAENIVVEASSVEVIDQPADPYETP
ncbi:MAG TPA: TIGR03943 family protein [Aquihabitans sp.]|nr:TIGR03943 family protein [Aquihabitans sp.]